MATLSGISCQTARILTTPMIHVSLFRNAPQLADDVSERMVTFLNRHPNARVSLATGGTPEPVYADLAAAVQEGRTSFRQAEVFLLDEFGGVPRNAAGRCEQMLRRTLLELVDLPDEQFHTPDPEAGDLDAMCRAYELAIQPGFDLTVLGIGTNGHIAMNEPGSPIDSRTRRVELTPETTRASARYFAEGVLPTWGVTTGIATLLGSREIWLLATGASKADAIRRTLHGPPSAEVPASFLQTHANCLLFADDAAASVDHG
jgi:glucosamine-6-phosphate deaminase